MPDFVGNFTRNSIAFRTSNYNLANFTRGGRESTYSRDNLNLLDMNQPSMRESVGTGSFVRYPGDKQGVQYYTGAQTFVGDFLSGTDANFTREDESVRTGSFYRMGMFFTGTSTMIFIGDYIGNVTQPFTGNYSRFFSGASYARTVDPSGSEADHVFTRELHVHLTETLHVLDNLHIQEIS